MIRTSIAVLTRPNPAAFTRWRAGRSGINSFDVESALYALPHLDVARGMQPNHVRFTALAPHMSANMLDFRASTPTLRRAGMLGPLLHGVSRLTGLGKILTSARGPELHAMYHDDLLDDAADGLGIQKDLMTDEAYRQELDRFGLPVLWDHTYDPTVQGLHPWPARKPARCPKWLWTHLTDIHAAVQYAEHRNPTDEHTAFLYGRVLITANDRVDALYDDLRGMGSDDVPNQVARVLLRAAPAHNHVWDLLCDLNDTIQERRT